MQDEVIALRNALSQARHDMAGLLASCKHQAAYSRTLETRLSLGAPIKRKDVSTDDRLQVRTLQRISDFLHRAVTPLPPHPLIISFIYF